MVKRRRIAPKLAEGDSKPASNPKDIQELVTPKIDFHCVSVKLPFKTVELLDQEIKHRGLRGRSRSLLVREYLTELFSRGREDILRLLMQDLLDYAGKVNPTVSFTIDDKQNQEILAFQKAFDQGKFDKQIFAEFVEDSEERTLEELGIETPPVAAFIRTALYSGLLKG